MIQGIWLHEALGTLKKDLPLRSCAWASWGDFDRVHLAKECAGKSIEYPFSQTHINIKSLFGLMMHDKVGVGLGKAIDRLGMTFEGKPHRAVDDAYNAAKVLQKLSEFELPTGIVDCILEPTP